MKKNLNDITDLLLHLSHILSVENENIHQEERKALLHDIEV